MQRKRKKTEPVSLEDQAQLFLEQAKKKGIENNYLFETSFRRYTELIAHLKGLQEAIKEDGMMVTKEYVKGRCNLYVNPAVAAYNQTAGAADKTAGLLVKMIGESVADGDADDEFTRF